MVTGRATSAHDARTAGPIGAIAPIPAPRLRWRPVLLVLLLIAAVAAYGWQRVAPAPPSAAAPPAPVRAPFDARGQVTARATARVASLFGGVIREVSVRPGDRVREGDALARVRTPDGSIEALSAPYAGTVLTVPVQIGDSVLPGVPLVVVGDLGEMRVESTDVDEYLVGSLRIGQSVQVEADAVPGRVFDGRIATVALATEVGAGGRPHYPVKIVLDGADSALRPNMNVRLRFAGQPGR
jgi:multidrug efflux pump subunit AcrA (membrane-fusion protein)